MIRKSELKRKNELNSVYLVATLKKWNIKKFYEKISEYPGEWHIITNKKQLTPEYITKIKPRYIFFPHWSFIVEPEILNLSECVCFHETDLPFGRGGSPLQNLISMGFKKTMISALKMEQKVDSGPIYLKHELSLEGGAEEIFLRASEIISDMILYIVKNEPIPQPQIGEITYFKRRTPEQSQLPVDTTLEKVFDHIRMLDAEDYPRAFMEIGNYRFEFSNPIFRTDKIDAIVSITMKRE